MLDKIWQEQPPGFYCLALKTSSGKWQDKFFDTISSAMGWLKDNKDSGDLYFCTTSLSDKRRVKGCVQSSRYLWQDLDEVDPDSLGSLRPTLAWQSSPGRYQALWRLDRPCEPSRLETLNKALAKKVGADRGSWILTKVLRIPGTVNHKYSANPKVKMLWSDGPQYNTGKLEQKLKPDSPRDTEAGKNAQELDYKEVYIKCRGKVPRKALRLLTADTATKGKRSEVLWYLEHELLKAGLSPQEVYTLVKNSVWNKFKGRSDEDERLMSEIMKATGGKEDSREEREQVINLEPEDEEQVDTNSLFSMTLQNDLELMTDIYQYPGWMVDGFWTRKSHGIIAGEPKSFKSTLALDMAVAVASGKKFLNEFAVTDPGPVLIVQNENAPWIMKDRLIKIRSNRGLVGEIDKVGSLYEVKFPVQLPMYYINQQGFNFNEPFHRKLLDKVMNSVQPNMVIFDPLYLMFDGDVNTSKDLNPILSWLLSLKDRHNCSLILIHHWKKGTAGTKIRGGQRMLGSTTLHGWVESAWYLDVKRADELEEEIFSEEFNSPSGSASLTLEREFRGAGTYPKLDMVIKMGDFGSTDYSVEIQKHKKERGGINEDDARKQIKELLELRNGRVTLRDISKEIGISRKVAGKLLKELQPNDTQS